jgi:SSS family solute:Na+ symporter
VIPNMGSADDPNLAFNNALPLLMNEYLPNGMLGLAITGLMASFMAGVAANVSAFNTVITTDLMEPYVRPGESDDWYVRFGRIATVGGLVVAMGTALIASTYDNLMNYVQALFSIFNSPLFGVFIIGMFWKRMTPWAGFWGLVTGTAVALGTWLLYKTSVISFGSDLDESMWGAGLAFVAVAITAVAVTLVTTPKPVNELQGLVHGMANVDEYEARRHHAWWESPPLLGSITLGGALLLTIIFW